MADCVIPPKTVIVKCKDCGALYVPDRTKDSFFCSGTFDGFEKCPICGQEYNRYGEVIPLWKYNLIKFFRGGFKK